jgi:hypothetical protein
MYIYKISVHPCGGVYRIKMILLLSRSNLQFGPDSSSFLSDQNSIYGISCCRALSDYSMFPRHVEIHFYFPSYCNILSKLTMQHIFFQKMFIQVDQNAIYSFKYTSKCNVPLIFCDLLKLLFV